MTGCIGTLSSVLLDGVECLDGLTLIFFGSVAILAQVYGLQGKDTQPLALTFHTW